MTSARTCVRGLRPHTKLHESLAFVEAPTNTYVFVVRNVKLVSESCKNRKKALQ